MKTEEFQIKLKVAQELMQQEKYDNAIKILEDLKEIEKIGDFDYSLTHKLYQLISNSKSLYNQQKILEIVTQIFQNKNSISLFKLSQKLKEQYGLELDLAILRREIELLILRSLLNCYIEGDTLIHK